MALVAIYNFIQTHDSETRIAESSDDLEYALHGFHAGDDHSGMIIGEEESNSDVDNRREEIAEAMWIQYQAILEEHLQDISEESGDNDEDSNSE